MALEGGVTLTATHEGSASVSATLEASSFQGPMPNFTAADTWATVAGTWAAQTETWEVI